MLVLRVIAGALGVVLLAVVVMDATAGRNGPGPLLAHPKGVYPGPLEPPLDPAIVDRLRDRGRQAVPW